MNDNEKVAALAAAVDGMRAEREWYRAAWLEATSQRDDLQARNATLEQIKASQNRYIGQYQEVLKERQSQLDLAEAALQECSVDEMNWNRERDRLEGDLEHAQNTVARLVEERDAAQAELRKHYGQRGTARNWRHLVMDATTGTVKLTGVTVEEYTSAFPIGEGQNWSYETA